MSDLAAWLDQQNQLAEELVPFRGRDLLVRELPLATLDEIAADKEMPADSFEGRIICAAVCDPETKEPVKPASEWQFWETLGTSFLPVRRAVIRLNKLNDQGVEDAVKK